MVNGYSLLGYGPRTIRGRLVIPIFLLVILLLSSSSSVVLATPVSKESTSLLEAIDETPSIIIRSYDGSGNNINQTEWGSVGSQISRLTSSAYNDSISEMSQPDSENPRIISNAVCIEEVTTDSELGLSNLNMLWSDFINNDIQLTLHQDSSHEGGMEEEHIPIPIDDAIMNPVGVPDSRIKYIRTEYIATTGDSSNNPRQFPNEVSTWLDGSSIYSTSSETNGYLRKGEGGKLLITEVQGWDMLPGWTSEHVEQYEGDFSTIQFFIGDSRNLDNIGLTTLQLLFIREHNRLATGLEDRNPSWSDDQLFERARKLVQAEIQAITYNEYLPSIGLDLNAYSGYNSSLNPEVSNEFTLLVAFASGSQMADGWQQLNETGVEIESGNLELRQGFWTQQALATAGGIEPTIRGAASMSQRQMDLAINPSLRSMMSGAAWGGWMDDCAMDIQRGRDRGLSDYNSIRSELGLSQISTWSELTSDVNIQQALASVYQDVNHLDAYIGVLAEPRMNGSIYGETQHLLAVNQFSRIRDADRIWYQNDAELESLKVELDSIRLSDIILRNTQIESIQCDVFFAENDASESQCQLENVELEVESNSGEEAGTPTIQSMGGIIFVVALLAVAAAIASNQNGSSKLKNKEMEEE